MTSRRSILFLLLLLAPGTSSVFGEPIRALIVDGRNNHNWRITTDAVRAALLEATGRSEEAAQLRQVLDRIGSGTE